MKAFTVEKQVVRERTRKRENEIAIEETWNNVTGEKKT